MKKKKSNNADRNTAVSTTLIALGAFMLGSYLQHLSREVDELKTSKMDEDEFQKFREQQRRKNENFDTQILNAKLGRFSAA